MFTAVFVQYVNLDHEGLQDNQKQKDKKKQMPHRQFCFEGIKQTCVSLTTPK